VLTTFLFAFCRIGTFSAQRLRLTHFTTANFQEIFDNIDLS